VDPEFGLGGGVRGTEESRASARDRYGLDDPLPVQYVRLMGDVVTGRVQCFDACGNLRDAFVEALPITLSLVLGAALLAFGGGTLLALVCVRHRGRCPDRVLSRIATVLYSIPSIVAAAVLWAYLCYRWEVFPIGGYTALTENPLDWAYHMFLPWIAAALPFVGAYTQVIRASMLEVADDDYVRTARAKGLPERRVVVRHVLRNALLPPIAVWGLDFSHAFGGFALYVEGIYGLPGVGALTETTLRAYDLPPIVALAVWLAFVVVVVSALVDIAMGWLDPRVRAAT
jgi:peptide/nickel transport system permease protein